MGEQIKIDEQVVRDLECEFIDACRTGDIETLDHILADSFIFTDPKGVMLTKSEWLGDMKSGDFIFEFLRMNALVVHVSNHVASAKAELYVKAKSNKGDYDGIYSAMDIYENRGGKWQIILSTANQLIAQS